MRQEEKYLGNTLHKVLDKCPAPISHIKHLAPVHRLALSISPFCWFCSMLPVQKVTKERTR